MTLLPVVERELRVASRRRWTYLQRSTAALIGILGLVLSAYALERIGSTNFGTSLFIWLSVILFITAGFGGVYAASDALSAERRENTLGLLFLTELSSLDVVLGKLVSCSLGVIYSLLALIPVLAIPLMAGGVEWYDVVRTVLTTLNLLFLGLCLGLVGSVIYQNALSSLAMGLGLGLACGFGALITAFILDEWFGVRIGEIWFVFTVFSGCYYSFPATLNGSDDTARYWQCLGFFHLVAWAALAFACYWIGSSWRDLDYATATTGTGKLSLLARFRAFRQKLSRQTPDKRRQQLDIGPYFWRSTQPWWRGLMSWIIVIAGSVFFIVGQLMSGRSTMDFGSFIFFAWLISASLKLGVCLEAPRMLAGDKKSGALELVLTTSQTGKEVIQGQLAALKRHFRGPSIFLLTAGILALFWEASNRPGNLNAYYNANDLNTLIAGMLVFVPDLFVCARFGVARSIIGRNELRAWSNTFFLVLALPWALFAVSMMFLSFSSLMIGSSFLNDYNFMLILWVGLTLLVDLIAWRWASRILSLPLQECAGGGNFSQPSGRNHRKEPPQSVTQTTAPHPGTPS